MKPMCRALAVISILALSWAVLAQGPMREGSWEVTMQMEMANMPMKMPAMKNIQCVTKEQLKNPGGGLPGASPDTNSDCKVSDYKVDGSKVTWKMLCSRPQKMSGSGEITFQNDSYDGVMKMTTDRGEMTMKYTAKRLGDCKP